MVVGISLTFTTSLKSGSALHNPRSQARSMATKILILGKYFFAHLGVRIEHPAVLGFPPVVIGFPSAAIGFPPCNKPPGSRRNSRLRQTIPQSLKGAQRLNSRENFTNNLRQKVRLFHVREYLYELLIAGALLFGKNTLTLVVRNYP